MARSRGPKNLLARRESWAKRADTDAHAGYSAMIGHDLGGPSQRSYRAVDEGRPDTAAQLLLRPVSLFLISCLLLLAVGGVWAWRMGAFAAMMPVKTAKVDPRTNGWMAGGKRQVTSATVTDADSAPPPSDTPVSEGDEDPE